MSLETLISTYGYPAIAVGTFFEGETILVLAGVASRQGYLDLTWVIVTAFFGSLLGDQLYFYIGRIKGIKILKKRPHWAISSKRVINLLHKHQLLLILGFRFFYGLRTVTPFLLGAIGVRPVRFMIINVIGALIWAVSVGAGGYLFGHVLGLLIGKAKQYELFMFAGLAAIGAVIWFIHWYTRRRALRRAAKKKE